MENVFSLKCCYIDGETYNYHQPFVSLKKVLYKAFSADSNFNSNNNNKMVLGPRTKRIIIEIAISTLC